VNQITEQVSAILMAVVGVAILAVLVSRNAQTGSVLQAGGQAFSSILGAGSARNGRRVRPQYKCFQLIHA